MFVEHKYLLKHPEPKYTDMGSREDVEKKVNEMFDALTNADPLVLLMRHLSILDGEYIDELEARLEVAGNSLKRWQKEVKRLEKAKGLDRLRNENDELKRHMEWIKDTVVQFGKEIKKL